MRLSALIAGSSLAISILVAPDSLSQRGPRGGGGANGGGGGGASERSGPKPYDEVITDKATSDPGLFLVHRLDDKIFYEIPTDLLGLDMLWVTQIARTQAGFGYGGTPSGERVVRWELRDENVLLRDIKYTIRAETDDSIRYAVESTSVAPIIMSFPVAAWGKDQRPVIDVTRLFTEDVSEFSAARTLGGSGVDSSRTFIEAIKSFPENIESKVLMTYRLSGGNNAAGGGGPTPGGRGERRDPTQSGVTALIHHSMVLLPRDPMPPRAYDDRVGFFTVGFQDYATTEHAVENVRYVTRWRLEKQDPSAVVSDPVKPIVFYIGREVPETWRPYVRKGIEMWRPAFEAAGFSNAIIAKDAPTPEEDPDWDAEDARISSIRWLPSTVENAMGPHVNDPRTGEILESDILMYHNVLKLCRDWYFVQASPNDPRAQSLPMPDDLLGELLAYVVAHEVGHTLGFPHNMKASSAYTVAQLRDPEFTKVHGTEASIMDYGRFNYVAQPGDGAALIPTIGPYDFFALEWGYRQFENPDAEKAGLAALVAKQKDDPMLLFGPGNAGEDPTDQTEDLGAEKIEATRLGLANIDRVAGYIVQATCKEGENYDLLENMYSQLLGQRARELGHVANVVGGFDRRNFWYGDAERVYHPVPADEQRGAVAFLNEHAFHVPAALVRDDIVMRLEAAGTADRVLNHQQSVLRTLLSEGRVKRMAEQAERAPDSSYAPRELVADLRRGIFSELEESVVAIDLYRRNLQRAFAETLIEQVRAPRATTDMPAIARGELEEILRLITQASERQAEDVTALHLKDLAARIDAALKGENAPATAVTEAPAAPGRRPGGE